METGLVWADALLIFGIILLNSLITVLIFRWGASILFPDATGAISRGMTALGQRSIDVRQEKALEKAITGDILDQFPEVVMLLNQLSPETADMVRKNPQMALNLIQRYKPLIDKFLPSHGSAKATPEYDL